MGDWVLARISGFYWSRVSVFCFLSYEATAFPPTQPFVFRPPCPTFFFCGCINNFSQLGFVYAVGPNVLEDLNSVSPHINGIQCVRIGNFSSFVSPLRFLLSFLIFDLGYFGCILLGLFWLFLFRFRNNRIHGISISKRTAPTCFRSGNGIGGDLRTTISAAA